MKPYSAAGESDFNHSDNPHSAALWASKKVRNIYVFLFFPPKGKVIKITHKLSPFPESDYNHFAFNELLINK